MKHKKATLITSVVMILIAAFTFVELCRYQPALPERWQQIHPGQPRSEVLRLFPELMTDLYDMKGFDQTVFVSESALFGRIWRNVLVRYDYRSNRVEGVWLTTYTSRFNFFRDHKLINRDT